MTQDARFRLSFQRNTAARRHWRYHVVEGAGNTRLSVSVHRSPRAAENAALRWSAPARVVVLDRERGRYWKPQRD